MKTKIKNICPSSGVYAVYKQPDGTYLRRPVILWGIVETPDGDEIRGYDAGDFIDVSGCEGAFNFVEYQTGEMDTVTAEKD
jgi:hypothetical protein